MIEKPIVNRDMGSLQQAFNFKNLTAGGDRPSKYVIVIAVRVGMLFPTLSASFERHEIGHFTQLSW